MSAPGNIIAGYRIERLLGEGGMGAVYLAAHPTLPRHDAIKVLSRRFTGDREFRARFEREANLAAGLDHPNIVSVYNRGEDRGQLWIAMQYVSGSDAAQAMSAAPQSMTPDRALRIVTEVGKALDYAHRSGLLHRDVKPANFLLSPRSGEQERVLLTDFGIAKSTTDTEELTQDGDLLATVAYASPEQLLGGAVDHRADIYSLACSFFRLLTGRNPFVGTVPTVVMMAHLNQPPPRATDLRHELPVGVDRVLEVAMAKRPDQRFGTCGEFTDALRAAMTGAQVRAPVGAPDRSSRQWLVAGAAAVLAIAVAVGVAVWPQPSSTGATAAVASTVMSTAASPKPTSVGQAKSDNPQFLGRQILLAEYPSYGEGIVYLHPGGPTQFLTDLGFRYHPRYSNAEANNSTKAFRHWSRELEPTGSDGLDYLVLVRTDDKAGGGMAGVSTDLIGLRSTIIVVDDLAAVAAIQNWTPEGEAVLLEKLLPLLRRDVK
ncbi:serine/threonine-protein kinase [Nocardia sp. NPDC058666]|uniref:serine/threonine-protein kinase n=1 Tax=unclassified Nocardia TaxID=2637762 RepID=UPI003664947F